MAVFLDVANLLEADLEHILRRPRRLGEIEIAWAYGNFANSFFLQAAAEKLFLQGIRLIHCPGWQNDGKGEARKTAADELMMVDICCLLDNRQDIDRFIICTGDGHFVPVVLAIRARGREAIVMGATSSTSRLLREAADRYLELPMIEGQALGAERHHKPDPAADERQPAPQAGHGDRRPGGNGNRRDRVRPDGPPPLRRPGLPPLENAPRGD